MRELIRRVYQKFYDICTHHSNNRKKNRLCITCVTNTIFFLFSIIIRQSILNIFFFSFRRNHCVCMCTQNFNNNLLNRHMIYSIQSIQVEYSHIHTQQAKKLIRTIYKSYHQPKFILFNFIYTDKSISFHTDFDLH